MRARFLAVSFLPEVGTCISLFHVCIMVFPPPFVQCYLLPIQLKDFLEVFFAEHFFWDASWDLYLTKCDSMDFVLKNNQILWRETRRKLRNLSSSPQHLQQRYATDCGRWHSQFTTQFLIAWLRHHQITVHFQLFVVLCMNLMSASCFFVG